MAQLMLLLSAEQISVLGWFRLNKAFTVRFVTVIEMSSRLNQVGRSVTSCAGVHRKCPCMGTVCTFCQLA